MCLSGRGNPKLPPSWQASRERETAGENDTYGSALMSALGQVAGAASYTNGLISPSNKIGLPDRVLPEPLSRNLRHPTMEAPDADSAPAPFSYRYTTLRDSTSRTRAR